MQKRCSLFVLVGFTSAVLAGCAETRNSDGGYDVPAVDYVESLNVEDAPHQDSFLNQLAMNYRSYAIFNARTSGYPDVAELFAQKAVSAFSGETPFPESLDNWNIDDNGEQFELSAAYKDLMGELRNDVVLEQPRLAAEAQAKFDCWISAASTHQIATAKECRKRFLTTLQALRDCTNSHVVVPTLVKSENVESTEMIENVKTVVMQKPVEERYYPETRRLNAMSGSARTREGVVIVNNVNLPSNLVQPVPVSQQQPSMIFNQNIYGGEENTNNSDTNAQPYGDYVSRDEFINLMNAMRAELAAINKRLDDLGNAPEPAAEKTVIKVQQIPLEPKQHVMEEVFEVRFDFDKSAIKPEYEDLIRKLAATTQANKNVKVSVVGHTDTAGSSNYNYALGGRRAEAVQRMLIEYGIPSSQIIAVSAGEEDLKVQTPNNTPNAENRRVRVVKEVHYTEQPKPVPLLVEEYTETEDCAECEEEN